jgi:hypothetical protein
MEINGKMSLVDRVEILDISLSGVSLKVDKKLVLGREYVIRLGDREKKFDVKGVIVRSEVCEIEEQASGKVVYATGMMFNGGQMDKLAMFLYAIDQKKKMNAVAAERRLNIRFQITTPGENVLSYPAQFKVRTISLSGMLIQTDHPLELESRPPMELSLHGDNPANLIGRVVSCQMREEVGHAYYEIGVEFLEVTEKDKVVLKAFTDDLAAMEAGKEGEHRQPCRSAVSIELPADTRFIFAVIALRSTSARKKHSSLMPFFCSFLPFQFYYTFSNLIQHSFLKSATVSFY